tara:strand:+ start:1490 stop:1810 length:321 start_codon:yes stop_codon:yes gene_type:complete
MTQTVTEILTAATDSVTVINDINTKGSNSIYAGSTTNSDGDVVASTWTQAEINELVQRNVDHLETILLYEPVDSDDETPDVAGDSSSKSSYTSAVTTGKSYISSNS